jgi:oxygen-independent coproporphyrinogen-3 oxidase
MGRARASRTDRRISGTPAAATGGFCADPAEMGAFRPAGGQCRRGTQFGDRLRMHTHAEVATTPANATAARIGAYDRPGPRYTSYPTAVEFSPAFDDRAYIERLQQASRLADAPLSLYVHLPFCAERCTYCGCTMIATRSHDIAGRYLEYLEREIGMLATHLGDRRRVVQHHWGGGTPTFLNLAQIERLHGCVSRHFDLAGGAEQAIEIDPRVTTREQLVLLRSLGFNRLSMGVQDFNPEVQAAIGRRQSESATRELYDFARTLGFDSINLDLIYGLPLQTLESFERTLGSIVAMRPDRIAVYSYAHVPWLRPHQKLIDVSTLPKPESKVELIGAAIDAFAGAGYASIGMDHFARPDDDLAVALAERRLHRNFMGYTTRPADDVLGLGISAIGDVQGAYAQNAKKLTAYYAALDGGRFPIERGIVLTADDLVRRHVITALMCHFRVDREAVARRFDIDFDGYFGSELAALAAPGGPVSDGLVSIAPDAVEITARGRLFVRTVCMIFDRYLAAHQGSHTFSRTI